MATFLGQLTGCRTCHVADFADEHAFWLTNLAADATGSMTIFRATRRSAKHFSSLVQGVAWCVTIHLPRPGLLSSPYRACSRPAWWPARSFASEKSISFGLYQSIADAWKFGHWRLTSWQFSRSLSQTHPQSEPVEPSPQFPPANNLRRAGGGIEITLAPEEAARSGSMAAG